MNSKLYYRTTYSKWLSQTANFLSSHLIPCDPTTVTFVDTTPVVLIVETSEGGHTALESDPAWHTMSLLISGNTLCAECVSALSSYGILSTDNMFNAGKKLAAIHPELRPTRF